jgi:HEAT repeat protein
MPRYREAKRAPLAIALTRVRTAQALDDLAEMLLRLMPKRQHTAQEALAAYRRAHQEQTDALLSLLSEGVGGWQHSETAEAQRKTISTLSGEDADNILEQCEAHRAYAGNNA